MVQIRQTTNLSKTTLITLLISLDISKKKLIFLVTLLKKQLQMIEAF